MGGAQIAMLPDGRRLHLQEGPIDLIVEAWGEPRDVHLAYAAAAECFTRLLATLCEELQQLRRQARAAATPLRGRIARRMHAAVAPFAADHFITPMAAVAGAVADDILGAMAKAAPLARAYVNNGGDIAFHLANGESLTLGLADRPDRPSLIGQTRIVFDSASRGVATSGWRGRSFSRGIADAVTVLAVTAAQADAAATIIANAVDLPDHSGIVRVAAHELQPDNDLREILVTRDVPNLTAGEIMLALESGEGCTRDLIARGLIHKAALHLQGETRIVDHSVAVSWARDVVAAEVAA